MNAIGRNTTWLFHCILICGGCASPSLLSPATSGNGVAMDRPGDSPRTSRAVASPMLDAETAMLHESALARGFSAAEATRFSENVMDSGREQRAFLTRYLAALDEPPSPPRTQTTSAPDSAHMLARSSNLPMQHSVPGPEESPEAQEPPGPQKSTVAGSPRHAADSPAPPGATSPPAAPTRAEDLKPVGPLTVSATPSLAHSVTHQPQQERGVLPQDNPYVGLSEREGKAGEAVVAANQSAQVAKRYSATRPYAAIPSPRGEDLSYQRLLEQTITRLEHDLIESRRLNPTDESHLRTSLRQLAAANAEMNPAKGVSGVEPAISWQRQLRLAITRLERDLVENNELDPLDERRMRACLGLLQLTSEAPEEAMEALENLDDQQQEFWRQTFLGLDILMNSDEQRKMRHRVEPAAVHLQRGLSALASLGPLRVQNLAFAKDVRGFGDYDETGARGFVPGEAALLYVEIENFTVDETAVAEENLTTARRRTVNAVPMFETDLLGRYDLLDQNQRVVTSRTLPKITDICRQRRRDFFIAYDFYTPEDIAPGHYTIELTIEDRKGDKFGNATIDLRVR